MGHDFWVVADGPRRLQAAGEDHDEANNPGSKRRLQGADGDDVDIGVRHWGQRHLEGDVADDFGAVGKRQLEGDVADDFGAGGKRQLEGDVADDFGQAENANWKATLLMTSAQAGNA